MSFNLSRIKPLITQSAELPKVSENQAQIIKSIVATLPLKPQEANKLLNEVSTTSSSELTNCLKIEFPQITFSVYYSGTTAFTEDLNSNQALTNYLFNRHKDPVYGYSESENIAIANMKSDEIIKRLATHVLQTFNPAKYNIEVALPASYDPLPATITINCGKGHTEVTTEIEHPQN